MSIRPELIGPPLSGRMIASASIRRHHRWVEPQVTTHRAASQLS